VKIFRKLKKIPSQISASFLSILFCLLVLNIGEFTIFLSWGQSDVFILIGVDL